jgi:hypothetical protein
MVAETGHPLIDRGVQAWVARRDCGHLPLGLGRAGELPLPGGDVGLLGAGRFVNGCFPAN